MLVELGERLEEDPDSLWDIEEEVKSTLTEKFNVTITSVYCDELDGKFDEFDKNVNFEDDLDKDDDKRRLIGPKRRRTTDCIETPEAIKETETEVYTEEEDDDKFSFDADDYEKTSGCISDEECDLLNKKDDLAIQSMNLNSKGQIKIYFN